MRAKRFQLVLPVRYRRVGEATWLDGKTENISHSGVLFRAGEILDVGARIEIAIGLSAAPASDIICQARIVRAETHSAAPLAALAATFSEYRFVPPPH